MNNDVQVIHEVQIVKKRMYNVLHTFYCVFFKNAAAQLLNAPQEFMYIVIENKFHIEIIKIYSGCTMFFKYHKYFLGK